MADARVSAWTAGAAESARTGSEGPSARTAGAPPSASTIEWGANARTAGAPQSASTTDRGASRLTPNSPTVHLVPRPYRSQPQGPPLSTPTQPTQPLRTADATPLFRRPPPRTDSLITCQSCQTLLSLAVLTLFIQAHSTRLWGCSMPRWICSE
jgi:hypothetical protein